MMQKRKKSNNIIIYYVIVFLITLLIHNYFHFMNDDTFFSNILNEYSIKEFILERYHTWTSRIIIESFLSIISRNIYIWRITNSLVITLLIGVIAKIFFPNNQKKGIYTASIIFLLYPFYQMSEAGFAATTLNYLWPLTFMLYAMLPFQYIYKNKSWNKKLLPTYIIAFLFACNQEQATCIGCFASLAFLIYCIKTKKSIQYPLTLLLISIFSISMILICPGNTIRKVAEINNCYPDYIHANLLDKIYLGIVSTCSILLSNFLVIFLFSFTLFIIILKEKLNKHVKLLGILQFIIILLLSIYRVYTILKANSIIEAYKYGIFYYHETLGHVFTLSIEHILILTLCIGMVINYCYLIYQLFKEKSYFLILTLLVGCGTRVLMGFSPTIFASGSRTMIYLYFSLLFIIISLWKHYEKIFSKRQKKLIKILIVIFIIINAVLTLKAIPLIENI